MSHVIVIINLNNGVKRNGKKFLEKLESYERKAYEGQCGENWLTELGENVTSYIRDCARNNTRATIGGLEKHIDEVAERFLDSQ